MQFADVLERPQNNLNLIRLIAALMVTFSHAYILTGNLPNEPFLRWTGDQTAGYLGVFVFFVVSGVLVTRSYARTESIVHYVGSRALRIYPALAMLLLLSAIPMGMWWTQLSLGEYLKRPEVWRYVADNLYFKTNHQLPGVFENLVGERSVNGSLWTLRYEVYAYFLVIVFGLLGLLRNSTAFNLTVAGLVLLYLKQPVGFLLAPAKWDAPILVPLLGFLFGAFVYVNRAHLHCRLRYLVLAAMAYLTCRHGIWNVPVVVLSVGYAALAVGFHPRLQLRLNIRNDYSYGIYLYSFPIQQTVVWLLPGLQPWQHFALALLFIIPMSALSWHALEQPTLKLKKFLPKSQPDAQRKPSV